MVKMLIWFSSTTTSRIQYISYVPAVLEKIASVCNNWNKYHSPKNNKVKQSIVYTEENKRQKEGSKWSQISFSSGPWIISTFGCLTPSLSNPLNTQHNRPWCTALFNKISKTVRAQLFSMCTTTAQQEKGKRASSSQTNTLRHKHTYTRTHTHTKGIHEPNA